MFSLAFHRESGRQDVAWRGALLASPGDHLGARPDRQMPCSPFTPGPANTEISGEASSLAPASSAASRCSTAAARPPLMLSVSQFSGVGVLATVSDRTLPRVVLSNRIHTNGISHSIFKSGTSASSEVPW